MQTEIDILKDVSKKLEGVGIAFMLSGSLAMNYYAVPRMTRDIDVVVELTRDDVEKIVHVFEDSYYISKDAVREAVEHASMFNIIHNSGIIKVDFIIRKNNEYRQEEFERRRKISNGDFDTWIVSKEDLIISKLYWAKDSHSEMQFRDIKNLMKSGYDQTYLLFWLKRLNLGKIFHEIEDD